MSSSIGLLIAEKLPLELFVIQMYPGYYEKRKRKRIALKP